MCSKQALEKALTNFGKNNSPTLVAMSIATAKGIFRPAFTMMDKKESYETKRYTALREGLTELIAIPVYYLSGVAANRISKKLAVPKNFMSKDLYRKHLAGDTSKEVTEALKHAEELAGINLRKITSTTSFAGVCLSALLIIPLVCSITIKPIMAELEKKSKAKKELGGRDKHEGKLEIEPIKKPKNSLNTFKGLYGSNNCYGMKVGGV